MKVIFLFIAVILPKENMQKHLSMSKKKPYYEIADFFHSMMTDSFLNALNKNIFFNLCNMHKKILMVAIYISLNNIMTTTWPIWFQENKKIRTLTVVKTCMNKKHWTFEFCFVETMKNQLCLMVPFLINVYCFRNCKCNSIHKVIHLKITRSSEFSHWSWW